VPGRNFLMLTVASLLLGTLAAIPGAQATSGAILIDTPRAYVIGRYASAVSSSRAVIEKVMDDSGMPGLGIAVALDSQIIWAEGFGYANLESKTPVTRHTKFGIGSISKSLTTALVSRLDEKGLIDIDAPLETYLPEFPLKGRGITIRLIAAHLSGLGDTVSAGGSSPARTFTTDEALRVVYQEVLKYEPRQQSHYSTSSYTLIAGAVERITGKSFPDLIEQHVTKPLGMANTVPNDLRQIISNRTAFYEAEENKLWHAPNYGSSFKLAGAGYLSTAEDIARFASALLHGSFLKPATVEELFEPQRTAKGEKTQFASGWRSVQDPRNGRDIIVQPGGGPGISSLVSIHRKERLVVVTLSNQTGAPAGLTIQGPVFDAFLELINGRHE
jgi:serine beta-lactamase-like protein LACTB